MFFIWNNGKLVININSITYIELTERGDDYFARIHFITDESLPLTKEMYVKLMKYIVMQKIKNQ